MYWRVSKEKCLELDRDKRIYWEPPVDRCGGKARSRRGVGVAKRRALPVRDADGQRPFHHHQGVKAVGIALPYSHGADGLILRDIRQ